MFSTNHLHPMIVHFPIALIMVGFLVDFFYLFYRREPAISKTGYYLMIFGTLAAVSAFITGHLFTTEPTQGEIVKVFSQHETAALITIIIMIIGSIVRIYIVAQKKEETSLRFIVLGLYFLGAVAVSYTGFMGGTMVYSYMMSI